MEEKKSDNTNVNGGGNDDEGVRGRGCPGPEGFERHKELQLPEDLPPSARPAYITSLITLMLQPVM